MKTLKTSFYRTAPTVPLLNTTEAKSINTNNKQAFKLGEIADHYYAVATMAVSLATAALGEGPSLGDAFGANDPSFRARMPSTMDSNTFSHFAAQDPNRHLLCGAFKSIWKWRLSIWWWAAEARVATNVRRKPWTQSKPVEVAVPGHTGPASTCPWNVSVLAGTELRAGFLQKVAMHCRERMCGPVDQHEVRDAPRWLTALSNSGTPWEALASDSARERPTEALAAAGTWLVTLVMCGAAPTRRRFTACG